MRNFRLAIILAASPLCLVAVHPATDWAREEYLKYSKAVFGSAPEAQFVLSGETDGFDDDFAALKDTDGYAVRKRDGRIMFLADCPRGHVNAVHRWLERNSDIVWPRPAGDMCFFTPGQKTAERLDCDYRDVPAFRLRLFGGAPDGETRRYFARNASTPLIGGTKRADRTHDEAVRYGISGSYCDIFGSGHDMESRWFPRSEFFGKHPEFWMEVKGTRWTGPSSNFCETNPDFAAAFSKSVEEKIAGLPPSVKIVSINMEDSNITCECENCLKPISLPDGTVLAEDDPAFKSTRFFIFFNKVARHLAKIRPDLKILQFAYLHLAIPPKIPVERNVILKFCPYPRNMRESVFEGPSNRKWRDRMEGWLENTPGMYWREYYFCQCIMYPRPIADTAAVDLRRISEKGVRYVYTDCPARSGDGDTVITMYSLFRPAREFFDMCAMEAWTVQKLFWDPSSDPETLRTDFLRRTFGPAASHVAEFYRLLRDSWYTETIPSSYSDNNIRNAARFIVAKGLSEKCRSALDAAGAAADNSARKAWIAKMREILDMWIRDSFNYMDGEIKVPKVKCAGDPSSGDGVWRKAALLPSFKVVRSPRSLDKTGSQVRVFSDGEAFRFAFDVNTPKGLRKLKAGHPGAYPCGDRCEIAFALKGTYFQFAFSAAGDCFSSKGPTDTFSCGWSVATEKKKGGWRAIARIPFADIGFEPLVDSKIKCMASISYSHGDARSQSVTYSLGKSVPHTPETWITLDVDINTEDE